jgi:hypothetical protein
MFVMLLPGMAAASEAQDHRRAGQPLLLSPPLLPFAYPASSFSCRLYLLSPRTPLL